MGRNKLGIQPIDLISLVNKMQSNRKFKIVDGIRMGAFTKVLIFGKIGLYKNPEPIVDDNFDKLLSGGYIAKFGDCKNPNLQTYRLTTKGERINLIVTAVSCCFLSLK